MIVTNYITLMSCDIVIFFFNDTATTEIYTLSLHDALPISRDDRGGRGDAPGRRGGRARRRPRHHLRLAHVGFGDDEPLEAPPRGRASLSVAVRAAAEGEASL